MTTVSGYGVKAESKSADTVILIGGLAVLAGVGYILWKVKKAAEAPGKAAKKVIETAKESVVNEENRATTAAQAVQQQFLQSGGVYTILPEIQVQDRFWTTQPKEPAETFTEFRQSLPV